MNPFEAELAQRGGGTGNPFDAELATRTTGTPGMPEFSAAPPSVAPAPTRARQIVDAVTRTVKGAAPAVGAFARGLGESAVSLPGLAVDAVNYAPTLLNLLPGERKSTLYGEPIAPFGPIAGDQPPIMGSQHLKEGARSLKRGVADLFGMTPPSEVAATPAERIGERIGSEVGATVIPGMGLVAKGASMGLPAVRELANRSSLGRMFLEPATVNPAGFMANEMAAAGAFGTGAGAVGEMSSAPQGSASRTLSEFFGGLGTLGALGVTRTLGPKAVDLVQAVRGDPNYVGKLAQQDAAARIAENFRGGPEQVPGRAYDTAPIVDAIERGRNVGETIPGFQESLADRTRNPGLASLEYSRQQGPGAGMFAERNVANNAAVTAALEAEAPRGQPGALREGLETERSRLMDQAATQAREAEGRFEVAARNLQTTMNAEARGAEIRGALDEALEAARGVERSAYNAIDRGEPVDLVDLSNRFGRLLNETGEASRRTALPTNLTNIPDDLVQRARAAATEAGQEAAEDAPALYPVSQVTDLRSRLSAVSREARTAGDPDKARRVDQFVDELDQFLEGQLPPDQVGAYRQAREVSRNLNDRFTRRQTAVGQTLQEREGVYARPDAEIPGKFVQPDEGRVSEFDNLINEVGRDRAARPVREQILAEAEKRDLLNKPEELQGFMQRYSRVLDTYPELRAELREVAERRGAVTRTQEGQLGLERQYGEKGKSVVAKYLQHGDEDAERAMQAVLASKKPEAAADELLNFAGNAPEAVEGARTTFWNILRGKATGKSKDAAGETIWRQNDLHKFLHDEKNMAVAQRLYRDNPEHLQRLTEIADALQGTGLRTGAKAAATSGTGQGVREPLLTTESINSRLWAWQRGQVSPGWVAISIAGTIGRRALKRSHAQAFDAVLDRALLDPDVAKQLLQEHNPANVAAMKRSAKLWMGEQAKDFAGLLDDSDDDRVRDALKRGRK